MSKMWEVDPETRSKLLAIQKENGNNVCVDCNAPSPQWASPKFGIFMCLSCSGIHRGLGVHISFVRSITMDAFKPAELSRMAAGGNKPWQDFFNAHPTNTAEHRTFDASSIAERYDSEAGDEWKERLTAKIEGKEYVPGPRNPRVKKVATADGGSGSVSGSRTQTPLSHTRSLDNTSTRSSSPSLGTGALNSRKAQNEAYFARMGSENANRPDSLPPSQGGKYSGFGSDPWPDTNNGGSAAVPGLDEFQKDPVAALTKGFGWFSTTVSKSAKTGYEGWVKPGMQKLQEADLATQARLAAEQAQRTLQKSTSAAATQFTRFVEGEDDGSGTVRPGSRAPTSGSRNAPAPERQDFWDSFGQAPEGPSKDKQSFWDEFANAGATVQQKKSNASVGTAAMRKPAGGSGGGSAGAQQGQGKEEEGWGEW